MSITHGLEKFKKSLSDFQDNYILIGGSACSLLYEINELEFRPTNDLDIIVVDNEANNQFFKSLWEFLSNNNYKAYKSAEGKLCYYRFILSKEDSLKNDCPKQIELFAKKDSFNESAEKHIAKLKDSESYISSFSAILLDSNYYELLRNGKINIDGVYIPDVLQLILLKIKAHIENQKIKSSGKHVNDRELRKHRIDVLNLVELVNPNQQLNVPNEIKDDVRLFISDCENYALNLPAKDTNLIREKIKIIERAYFING